MNAEDRSQCPNVPVELDFIQKSVVILLTTADLKMIERIRYNIKLAHNTVSQKLVHNTAHPFFVTDVDYKDKLSIHGYHHEKVRKYNIRKDI